MAESIFQPVPFVGGLDEKTAPEWNDPAKQQASITNGDFVKVGSISKRVGIKHLPNTLVPGSDIPAIDSGVRAAAWSRSSLTLCSETGLYQYADAEGGTVGVAALPDTVCVRRPIVTSPTRTRAEVVDMPYNGTTLRIAVFWDVAFNLVATVYDADDGDIILEPTILYAITGVLASGTIPVLVSMFYLPNASPLNAQLNIFVQDQNNNHVYAIHYSPTSNTFSVPFNLFTVAGVGSIGVCDVVPFADDPSGTFVAMYSTSTTNVRIQRYSTSYALLATKNQAVPGGTTIEYPCYAVCTWGEHCWFFYQVLNGATFQCYALQTTADGAFTTEGSPLLFNSDTGAPLLAGAVRLGANDCFVLVRKQGISTDGQRGYLTCNGKWFRIHWNGAAVSAAATGPTPLGFYHACRPFMADGSVYQFFYFNLYLQAGAISDDVQSQQITGYLCKYQNVDENVATTTNNVVYPVATVAPRQVNANFNLLIDFFSLFRLPFPSVAASPASTRIAVGLKTNGTTTSALDGPLGPAWAVDFYFDSDTRRQLFQASELGTELSLSGGVPFCADGSTAFEDNFFYYPEFSYTKLGGSGVADISGVYTYAIVYSYADSAGLLHQSAPVFTNTVTVPGNGTTGPQVHITPLSVTYRDIANPGTVFADIYRTLSNGSIFYFLDRLVISNMPTATIVIYPGGGQADNWSDNSLATGTTLIYTTGGVMDQVNPPASSFQIAHRGRKAVVDELRRNVWFTKEYSEGEAPGFNEAMIIPFPEGGDITAIRSMDDKFIAFKATSIWVMTGDGPSDTGQGSDWSVPQPVSTDVGCVNWQSVVLTPMGLMFKATNGLYLLGRDLQVTFIGKAVIDLLTDFPAVTSATLVPTSTHVRFTCTSADGTDSIVVVYDYLLGQWTKHVYPNLSAPIASACLTYAAPQKFTILTTDGQIWQERLPDDQYRYFDEDQSGNRLFVSTSVTVPWLKTQLQGYMRMRRFMFFGDQQDDCGVRLDFAFDDDPTIVQSSTWYSYMLSELPIPGQVEAHIAGKYNSCQMFQVTITDIAGSSMTTGAGMRFVSGAYELQPKGQRYRGIPVLGRQ